MHLHYTRISGKSIGKIDLKGVYTFFEVENSSVDKVFSGFSNVDFNGRQVRVERAGEGRSESRGENRGGNYRHKSPRGNRESGGFRDFSGKRKERKSRW